MYVFCVVKYICLMTRSKRLYIFSVYKISLDNSYVPKFEFVQIELFVKRIHILNYNIVYSE